jgi:TolB-like protein/Tfp pilus assembly protein PilF
MTEADCPDRPPEGRLDSWKEIAAHLKRGVTTVQRWEKDEGLPVHRLLHSRGDSVFAWRSELDSWWRERSQGVATPPPRHKRSARLMVLPFDNLTGDPDQEYVAGGLTEELITRLARCLPRDLAVIARTTAMVCKATGRRVRELAEDLDLQYVVEGSVRRSADQLRIAVQLIDARSETHLWAETRELLLGDLVALQSEVAEAVATQLMTATSMVSPPSTPPHSVAPAAYEAYLKAVHLLWHDMTESGLHTSITLFRRAIEASPDFAQAHAGVAQAYRHLGGAGINVMAPREILPPAREAARRALQIDDSVGEAHTVLGVILWQHDWNPTAAERELRRGVDLSPSHAMGHALLALCLQALRRDDEAIAACRRAKEIDPLSVIVQSFLVFVLADAGRVAEAEEEERIGLKSYPEHWFLHYGVSFARMGRGDFPGAADLLRRSRELCPTNSNVLSWLGHATARAGLVEEARGILEGLLRDFRQRYVTPWAIANVYAGLGDNDHAFEWLDKALEERSGWLAAIRSSELSFGILRSDPRYEDLCRRVGL